MEDYSLKYERDNNVWEYYQAVIKGSDLSTVDPNGDDVFAKGVRAIWEGLKRLDAVPRSAPFWSGRNHRSTLMKISEYSDSLLKENPDDLQAVWTQLGLDLLYWINPFCSVVSRSYLIKLLAYNEINLSDIARIGLWSYERGFETTGYWKPMGSAKAPFIDFLKQNHLCVPIQVEILNLGKERDDKAKRWAAMAIKACV